MQAAAAAPALAPPILLPLFLPTGAGSSARPRRAARAAVRCELAAAASSAAPAAAPGSVAAPRWAQRTVVIPPQRRGCHIITHKIMHAIRSDLSEFKCGLAHLFCMGGFRPQAALAAFWGVETMCFVDCSEQWVYSNTVCYSARGWPGASCVLAVRHCSSCTTRALPSLLMRTMTPMSRLTLKHSLVELSQRVHLLHGGTPLKDLMTCQHILNHQCLAVP